MTPYRLELLNEEQALAAVQKPAADVEVNFSDEAAKKLVGQLRRVTGQTERWPGKLSEEGQYRRAGAAPGRLPELVAGPASQQQWAPRLGPMPSPPKVRVDESLGDFYDKTVARIASKNDSGQRDIRDWFDRELISEQGLRAQVMGSDDSGSKPGSDRRPGRRPPGAGRRAARHPVVRAGPRPPGQAGQAAQ